MPAHIRSLAAVATIAYVRIVVIVLLVAVLPGGYLVLTTARDQTRAQGQKLRDSQIRACHRGNKLRKQIDLRGSVLTELLSDAAAARRRTGSPGDRKTAAQYDVLRKRIHPLGHVPCQSVVPKLAAAKGPK